MSTSKVAALVVGQVIRCSRRGSRPVYKVRAPKMSLDTNLLMYFPRKKDYWCVNSTPEDCTVGDIVVVRERGHIDDKLLDVKYRVDSIMFKNGAVIDPVTGRPCRGTEFLDTESRVIEQSKRKVEEFTKLEKVES
ncbi:37S ribosomal protein S17 mitochondrial [Mactra antiquata]